MTQVIARDKRFPFPIPYGWFHVGFVDDVEPGGIKPVRYFGKELVLWRTASGEMHLQDAYCPHLGANFGAGGEVVGEGIKCPFHHWVFNGEGRVIEIPYAKRLNEKACVRTYPLAIRHGIVMAWYHPEAIAPLYELPFVAELDDPAYVKPISTAHTIKTCIQEMGENTADGAHFVTVHGHPGSAEYGNFEFRDQFMIMESTQVFPSSGGPVEGTLKSTSVGFGWAEVRYQTLIEVCMLTTNVPVDDETVIQYFHVSYKNPERDPKIDRIGAAFNKEVNRQLTDDAFIWENKRYEPFPQLCDGDGPIARYRKWAKQFYVEAA